MRDAARNWHLAARTPAWVRGGLGVRGGPEGTRAIVCAMSTLAEDLIILAVGLKPKAGPNTGVLPLRFEYGLRGGELVALTMAGRVAVMNGRIVVRSPIRR
jgi:hypothetical protein